MTTIGILNCGCIIFLPWGGSILGLAIPSAQETFSSRYWTSLFSVDAFKQQIELRLNTNSQPGVTKETLNDEFDIIRSDGALTWSKKHQKRFTSETALNDAKKKADANKTKRLEISQNNVSGLGKLLDFLNRQGTRVILAQTPFHPAYYSSIADTPYGKDLQRIEAETNRLAKEHGVLAVGTFNPDKVGCTTSNFIDYHHANQDCLANIFNSIPDL